MNEFTPLASLQGGLLIGLSAVLLMAFNGRIAGIAGIASRLLPPYTDHGLAGRAAFVIGLIAAPIVMVALGGTVPAPRIGDATSALLIIAGILVGFGSVLGSGCTSGHGVCGLSRFSRRSMVAVATFMATAIATVYVVRHAL